MITFCPMFSGSSGNAIFVDAGGTRILIDAGLPGRVILGALDEIGVQANTISAILVTHEHSDHIKGVGVLSRKLDIPVYANERTWAAMRAKLGEIPAKNRMEFETGNAFLLGDMDILPFAVPHDAAEAVGFRIYFRGRSVATATDCGHISKKLLSDIAGVDLLLLESNHDPDMLRHNEHYSAALKARILSGHGHLSNGDCACALLALYRTGVRHVILGHLSGENNLPELALSAAHECMRGAGLIPDVDMRVDMAWRDHVGKVYTIMDETA